MFALQKWLDEFDKTINNTATPIISIDFKAYESNFLKKILQEFGTECARLDRLDVKDRERQRCCTVMYQVLFSIRQEILILDNTYTFIQDKINPYLSMEIVYIKLLKSFVGITDPEKAPLCEALLKRTIRRVFGQLEWLIQTITRPPPGAPSTQLLQSNPLEFFKPKLVEAIDAACEELKYFDSVRRAEKAQQVATGVSTGTKEDDKNTSCLMLLVEIIFKLRETYKEKVKTEEVVEVKRSGLPVVETLKFYEEGKNTDQADARFQTMIEMSETMDMKRRVFDEKNTILKAVNNRDMEGEPINLRDIMDKITNRDFKLYITKFPGYFKNESEGFHDKTYERLIRGDRRGLGVDSDAERECGQLIDMYFKFRDNFNLEKYFRQKMKSAEEALMTKIGKEREARKHQILNETKDAEITQLDEDNDDEVIRKFVRGKIIQRKLLVTTRFWTFLDIIYSHKSQIARVYYDNKRIDLTFASSELHRLTLYDNSDINLSLKRTEAREYIATLKPDMPRDSKKNFEAYLCEQPMYYRSIITESKFCYGNIQGLEIKPQETEPEPEPERAELVQEYKIIAGERSPEEFYYGISNNPITTYYTYNVRDDKKLQIRQIDRFDMLKKFTKRQINEVKPTFT